jgi:excinuclease ABC subunit C
MSSATASPSAPAARAQRLLDRVRAHAENRPGVYRIYGAGATLLYVGKSVRLRTRLLSYFRAPHGEKAEEIVRYARSIAWDYVPSEFAALLRELRLIRAWRPPFNVQGKAQRTVCFVQVGGGQAPRLLALSRPLPRRAGPCFGPLQGLAQTRLAVRDLADLLELRDCRNVTIRFADQVELFGHRDPPLCWRAETARCLAPCAAGCGESDYRARVEAAVAFLTGRSARPLEILHARLRDAVQRLAFEYAANLRDRIQRLDWLQRGIVEIRRELATLSFLYHVRGWNGDDRVYFIRGGRLVRECAAPADGAAGRGIALRAHRIYGRPAPPIERVPADQVAEMLLVARWFRLHPEERRHTTSPAGVRGAVSAALEPDDPRPDGVRPSLQQRHGRRRTEARRPRRARIHDQTACLFPDQADVRVAVDDDASVGVRRA